jgi:FkbM family methyltransferase
MKDLIKNTLKKILFLLHLDITRNQQYDRQTRMLLKRVLHPTSNCIDIGCHKGEIMDLMLRFSPKGTHFGFEPIPHLFQQLEAKYRLNEQVRLFDCALSDEAGSTTFNYVVNAPAYSGIRQRHYDRKDARIELIQVKLEKLDMIIPAGMPVNLIKIDVEGAEFLVLKGAKNTIVANKPFIIFECGLGASDHYGTKPDDLYAFLTNECGLKLSLLRSWLANGPALTQEGFRKEFDENTNYYFLAHP